MPASPSVVIFATAAPIMMLVAYLLGRLALRLLRGRARLSRHTSTILSVLGAATGMFVAGMLISGLHPLSPVTLFFSLVADVIILGIAGAVAWRFQRAPALDPIEEVAARGESDRLEFKSTARVNLHTRARDDRIEHAAVKSVAAFLNSDGGTLLLGVSDDGSLRGLTEDFATLRTPDPDRYELWLRDLLGSRLGAAASALPGVDFTRLDPAAAASSPDRGDQGDGGPDRYVCRITCPPAPFPVYLRPVKGADGPEFWLRIGNSSRRLPVDDAVDYVAHRWPMGLGAHMAAQARAAVRHPAP